MIESEEKQIAKIENFIIVDVFRKDKVAIKTLRHDLSGFRSPRDPNGNQKLTREEIDSIVLRLYKKGLLRKQQGSIWIPFNSKTFEKLNELGVLEKLPRSMPDNIKIVAKTEEDQTDYYDLFKEIRREHIAGVETIVNQLQYVFMQCSFTALSNGTPTKVRVIIPADLEWPLNFFFVGSSLKGFLAKLQPSLKRVRPQSRVRDVYSIIVKCFSKYKPDPWPLREQRIVGDLFMEGDIWFDDPVLKYSLSNVWRWACDNKLPRDLLEFLRTASKLKAKSKPEEFTAKMEN